MSNDKQIKVGGKVKLWTGEIAKLEIILDNGMFLVSVAGEVGVWHMLPEHVSVAD